MDLARPDGSPLRNDVTIRPSDYSGNWKKGEVNESLIWREGYNFKLLPANHIGRKDMNTQELYYDAIGYMIFCFTLSEKKEYVHIFNENDLVFWDRNWTTYFEEINKSPTMSHYSRPYSVIMHISMFSDEFFYEDFDGRYIYSQFLGEIIDPKVFSWISRVDNLDMAVLLGLTQNGIPLNILPEGGWRKITPLFLKKYGDQALKLIETASKAKKRSWGSYKEYLKSDHWQTQRKLALRNADYRCQVCNSGNKQLDVHHRTYERLGSEIPADLIVLCNDCHTLFHKNNRLKSGE
jgi:hypothetical protein